MNRQYDPKQWMTFSNARFDNQFETFKQVAVNVLIKHQLSRARAYFSCTSIDWMYVDVPTFVNNCTEIKSHNTAYFCRVRWSFSSVRIFTSVF